MKLESELRISLSLRFLRLAIKYGRETLGPSFIIYTNDQRIKQLKTYPLNLR
jgi:hypothetical protein